MTEHRLHREGCEDTLHLDGARRVDKVDGRWKGVGMTKKATIELVERHREFYEQRAAKLRTILEDLT